MPLLLVKRIDYTHPTNDALSFKRGDTVEVMPPGTVWEKIEADLDEQFAIIDAGPSSVTALKHLEIYRTIPNGGPNQDEVTVVLRRHWTIDFDNMNAGELADLDTAPYKTVMTPGRITALSKEKP